jgi:outer membrane protein TolC
MLIGFVLISANGCSRIFWRKQADKDTYNILSEKLNDPRWAVPRLDITPDQRSRFFDPYDPDKPPLPPDDPAANEYMHRVAGMKSYKSWHKFGQSFSAENPDWLSPFDLTEADYEEDSDEQPEIKNMTLSQAVELASIHSREYQTEIENLYLAALSLTFDRFQFAVRYLGAGGEPSSSLTHTSVPDGENSLALNNRFGISRLLPTGGQWIVELTNNTLWFFSGENTTSTASVISYSLVQPLLMGAGRKVVLESLTLQERTVLYETRNLARFRKTFFTSIVSSYLNILQNKQAVSNRENNIRLTEQQLDRLVVRSSQKIPSRESLLQLPKDIVFPESISNQVKYHSRTKLLEWKGGMTDEQEQALRNASQDLQYQIAVSGIIDILDIESNPLDVIQLESTLAASKNSFEQAKQRFSNSLDQFKIQLGLPTDFVISIDDFLLKQFVLIDPRLRELSESLDALVEQTSDLQENSDPEKILSALERFKEGQIKKKLDSSAIKLVHDDLEKNKQNIEQRKNQEETDPYLNRVIEDVAGDTKKFNRKRKEIELELRSLDEIKKNLREKKYSPDELSDIGKKVNEHRQNLLSFSQTLQVIQVGLRVELIKLQPYPYSMKESVEIGLEGRLDLMNARANMMDARRNMEVVANRLESILDLRVEGDIRTSKKNNPLDFRGDNSTFRAGISFTAPLDQVAERNDYRRAIITYQRAKRDYMAFEDTIKRQIRENHRNLVVSAKNFETTRQAVRINALQYDSAVENTNDPANTNDQGLNILKALNDVLSTQDQLISIWVSYEQSRLNIYRDMGMMEVDEMGLWNDPFYQELSERSISHNEKFLTTDSSNESIGAKSRGTLRSGNDIEEEIGNFDEAGLRDSFQLTGGSFPEKKPAGEEIEMEIILDAGVDSRN